MGHTARGESEVSTATAQPAQKVIVGKVHQHGHTFTLPVRAAVSCNEARSILERVYPLVISVWIDENSQGEQC
jgi:hypothetical protein